MSYASPAPNKITPEELALRRRKLDNAKREIDRGYAKALAYTGERSARIWRHAAEQTHLHENPRFQGALAQLKMMPVTIGEFLDSKEFVGEMIDVWPNLRADIEAMNPDVLAGQAPVHEVLMGGATGIGKTEGSRLTLMYQNYLLTCFREPQKLFGLPPSTIIVTMFQTVQSGVTRRALYLPFREMFTAMQFTRKWVRYDRHREASLVIEGGIEIVPAVANVNSMLGQAINGAHLDEANFMQVIENSKQAAGNFGQGGTYDQADLVYRTIKRRRRGRFSTRGPSIGCICVSSSTRYKNDFLDRRIEEVKANKEPNVLTFRHKQYDIQPAERYCGEKFRVIVGNDHFQTRVLKDHEVAGEDFPENAEVELVPIEYKPDFQNDPEGSTRDVIGVAVASINPFIGQRHKIVEAFLRGTARELIPWVCKQNVELEVEGLPSIIPELLPSIEEREKHDWFLHVDPSLKKDRCGIAIARTDGTTFLVNKQTGITEEVPRIVVPMALSIKPSRAAELDLPDVRQWIIHLKLHYKFNIRLVSYDQFQSAESLTLLRRAGIPAEKVSVDADMQAYDALRDALYSDRLDLVENEILQDELANLERHEKKDKVDHPPKGSKDVSDAVAGAVWNAIRFRASRSTMAVETTMQGPAQPRSVVTPRRNIRRK